MTPVAQPLRARMHDDMRVRNFADATHRDDIRAVKNFAAFLGRSAMGSFGYANLSAYQKRQLRRP